MVAGAGVLVALRFIAPAEDHAVRLVPPDAVFYAHLFLAPSTDQKMALEDLLARFPATDTEDEAADVLAAVVEEILPSGVSYADVEPWLGDEIAVFASPPGTGSTPDTALLVATDDADAALTAYRRARPGLEVERTYRGVDYLAGGRGEAAGVADGFLVAGQEAAVRAALDAARGEALADASRFRRTIEPLREDRLALAYVDLPEAVEAVLPSARGSMLAVAPRELSATAAVAYVRPDAVVVEAAYRSPGRGAAGAAPGGVGLLADLPGESWAGAGLEGFGRLVRARYEASIARVPFGEEIVRRELTRRFGIDPVRDLLAWIGRDAGLFAIGGTESSVGGGLIVETLHPETSRGLVNKLAGIALAAGQPVRAPDVGRAHVDGFALAPAGARGRAYVLATDRHVLAVYGRDAAAAALRGRPRLGDTARYAKALGGLGDGYTPVAFVDARGAFAAARAAGAVRSMAIGGIELDLSPVSFAVAGFKLDGDLVRARLVTGVE